MSIKSHEIFEIFIGVISPGAQSLNKSFYLYFPDQLQKGNNHLSIILSDFCLKMRFLIVHR